MNSTLIITVPDFFYFSQTKRHSKPYLNKLFSEKECFPYNNYVAYTQVAGEGNGLQTCRLAANVLNKQAFTDKEAVIQLWVDGSLLGCSTM